MNTRIIFVILIVSLAAGCQNAARQQERDDLDSARHEEHEVISSEMIELDQGKRWRVNEEIKPSIIAIESLLDSVERSEATDYASLGRQMQGHLDQLIASCTMTGKSHEELHKWLAPMIGSVKDLTSSSNREQADIAIRQMQESMRSYHQYFE